MTGRAQSAGPSSKLGVLSAAPLEEDGVAPEAVELCDPLAAELCVTL